ncbi:imelysin family protein [Dyadobacter chenwenxiniae]|uniref:Imelysin family protein n=1 Tax=Dyadobacter chenwenxiniae TaxID=2906456 RepID=A0A9X1PN19_9BACT|nr:imelysin family protein [Dyadobacter chenwenxiniae]MCF0062583.1 imelysin family protein [Dyadobacter chenwenxiniae]UON83670.1 imelysin family protein [Dyadobacter chenwenxiniae]
MKMKNYLAILLTFFFLGCSDSKEKPEPTPVDEGKDRAAMLTHLADNIIIPSYDSFQGKFDVMVTKSNAFAAKPDATTLTEFRTAWVDAYTEWQKVELFDFGPGEKHTIRNFFNIYPASEQGIAANIADPNASLETPDSYPKQGFPALDYLINGIGATDAAIIAQYTTAPNAAAKLAYINRVTDRMDSILDKVTGEWKGAYKETFVTKTGLDIGSSTSLLVNGYVLHYERYIRSGKFGIPSGAMLNGVPAPEKVEAFYKKDISLVLAKTAHQAYIDFFNGKNARSEATGPSLKTYLDALGAKDSSTGKSLTELLNAQFEASKTKLNALKPNLSEEVKTNNQVMKDTYNEMQKAVRMLKVDMTSAMSITITYTDNDGD